MKLKKLDMRGFSHDVVLVLFIAIFAIGGVAYLVASHAASCTPTPTQPGNAQPYTATPTYIIKGSTPSGCQSVSGPVTGPPLAQGEQLSIPPARRPAQYLHLCSTGNPGGALTYFVTQGTPNCLPNTTFQYDYAPSVPGTLYSIACETTSGTSLRYVYISTTESCPSGTVPQIPAPGEQLSIPPARRPAQYIHLCTVANGTQINYVSQGTPNCLTGDTFRYDYAPTVTGTVYNTACSTTSGTYLRYIYISASRKCPTGTIAS